MQKSLIINFKLKKSSKWDKLMQNPQQYYLCRRFPSELFLFQRIHIMNGTTFKERDDRNRYENNLVFEIWRRATEISVKLRAIEKYIGIWRRSLKSLLMNGLFSRPRMTNILNKLSRPWTDNILENLTFSEPTMICLTTPKPSKTLLRSFIVIFPTFF